MSTIMFNKLIFTAHTHTLEIHVDL